MITTMTIQPSRAAQAQERRLSPSANSAGAPLPLIPRRTSSSRPALSCSPSMPLPVRSSTSASSLSSYASSSSSTTVTTLAPPTNDSDSTSTSSPSDGTRPTIRTRRVRGVRAKRRCIPARAVDPNADIDHRFIGVPATCIPIQGPRRAAVSPGPPPAVYPGNAASVSRCRVAKRLREHVCFTSN